jgi:hypothetical protein
MSAQIQILQNNIGMMFLFRDAAYEDTEYLNAFHEAVVMTVQDMRNLLVVQLQDGTYELTEFGKSIQMLAISGIEELRSMMQNVVPILQDFVKLSAFGLELFKAYLIPIKTVIAALGILGPNVIKLVVGWNLLNKVIPISTLLTWGYTTATIAAELKTSELVMTKMAEAGATPAFLASGMAIVSMRNLQTWATKATTLAYWNELYVQYLFIPLMKMLHALKIIEVTWEIKSTEVKYMSIGAQYEIISLAITNIYLRAQEAIQLAILYTRTAAVNFVKTVWMLLTGQEVTLRAINGKHIGAEILLKKQDIVYSKIQNIINSIQNKRKQVSILLSKMATKAYWEELFVKIQGNQADKVSLATRLKNIWARMTEIGATIKKVFWQIIENVQTAYSNALNAIWQAMLYVYLLPGRIMETMTIAANSVAKWWNNLAEEAGVMIRVKAIIGMILKNVVTVIATAIIIVSTIVQWAWNISLYANPVVLVAMGVVLLVVGLVALAIRMRESIDIVHIFNMVLKHTFDMLLYFPRLIWNAFTGMGNAVMDVMEGPLFKLFLFVRNIFRFLLYHVKLVGNWFKEKLIDPLLKGFAWIFDVVNKWLIQPILGFFGFIHAGLSAMRNPIFTMANLLMKYLVDPLTNAVERLVGWVKDIVQGLKDAAGSVGGFVGGLFKAEGGYVQAMAEGGSPRGKHPYIVGEKGPELFMPQSPGKIIPNKDLNTQRVNNMIASYESPHAGAENAYSRASGNNMVVQNLKVRNANMKSSRVGIDTFGGYI